jgi:hypothetical protein
MKRQTDRQTETNRATEKQADEAHIRNRQTDRHTEKCQRCIETDKEVERQTHMRDT